MTAAFNLCIAFLKHLREPTMYPLWQHRPHGILVHYSVAVCVQKIKIKKNGQKEIERKKTTTTSRTRFQKTKKKNPHPNRNISWAAAVSGAPLRRRLRRRLQARRSASAAPSHRAAETTEAGNYRRPRARRSAFTRRNSGSMNIT